MQMSHLLFLFIYFYSLKCLKYKQNLCQIKYILNGLIFSPPVEVIFITGYLSNCTRHPTPPHSLNINGKTTLLPKFKEFMVTLSSSPELKKFLKSRGISHHGFVTQLIIVVIIAD